MSDGRAAREPAASTAPAPPSTTIPVRNLWHMLIYAWDLADLGESFLGRAEASPSLLALIADVLCDLVEQRMRRGLPRGYRPVTDELPFVRGKIHAGSPRAWSALDRGRVLCSFETFDADIPRNGVVRSTLRRLAGPHGLQRGEAGERELRERLSKLDRRLEGIAPARVTSNLMRGLQTGREDRIDRQVMALCDFVHHGLMPTEDAGSRHVSTLARERINLPLVYERFVARFSSVRLTGLGWTVRPQRSFHWQVAGGSPRGKELLPSMRPDLVLDHAGSKRRVVLDTKFTSVITTNTLGAEVFRSAHIYQMFSYMSAREARGDGYDTTGTLLYPSLGLSLDEHVTFGGATVRFATVDLERSWPEIEAELVVRCVAAPTSAAPPVPHCPASDEAS